MHSKIIKLFDDITDKIEILSNEAKRIDIL